MKPLFLLAKCWQQEAKLIFVLHALSFVYADDCLRRGIASCPVMYKEFSTALAITYYCNASLSSSGTPALSSDPAADYSIWW